MHSEKNKRKWPVFPECRSLSGPPRGPTGHSVAPLRSARRAVGTVLGARDRDPAVPCRPCDNGVFSKPPPTKAQVTHARTWDGTTCLTRLLCAAEGAACVNTPGGHHRGHVGAGRDCSGPGLALAKCGISRGGGTLRPPRAAPARPLPRVGSQRLETYGCC